MTNRMLILAAALTLALTSPVFSEEAKSTMKAIVVHEFGGPEMLKMDETARPEPKEDEILVRVMAAGVNPVDTSVRNGRAASWLGVKTPVIPGSDIAGVVEKTGANVTQFKAGDAVYAYLDLKRAGGYAQFCIAKTDETAAKPKSVTFEAAAAVPLAALTAWQALVDAAKLGSGQTVLIHGGSGGVGSFAVQIAKARGAKVIATASSANQELLKQLGADVTVDYTRQKFEDVAKDVDVVLDGVGKDTLERSYSVVKKGGFITTIVSDVDQAQLDKYGIRGASVSVRPDGKELAEITQLIDAGKIKPFVSQVLPLRDAPKAHEQAATHHTRGKIVLKVADAK